MAIVDQLELVSEGLILKIKNLNVKSEITDLDYKEIFKISDTKSKVEFVKDICAFANSQGGYIIYGVNKNHEWIGLDDKSDTDVDNASIANIIDEYIDGHVEFITNIINIEGSDFFIIYVFESNIILSFKKVGQYNKIAWGRTSKQINTCVFKIGDVYCRRNSRSIRADNLFYQKKKNKFKIIENINNQNSLYNEFIGRKENIEELYQKLSNSNNRIIQIDGIGGIGKTTFVHYFCNLLINNPLYKSDFDFIIWTSSKRNKYTPSGIKTIKDFISNYSDLIEDIHKFIQENGLENDLDTSDIEKSVISFITTNKVLLVVDNLETLNDPDLIIFLENIPNNSKAILTTRETLGDFYMARINLNGFKAEDEFPDFLNSQYKIFSTKNERFTDLYDEHIAELYQYTKGMPLAGQLITHQLAMSTSMSSVIANLKSGNAYHDILTFCFQGSIEKLRYIEKTLLYIFSISEKEELLTVDDLIYISGFSDDDIGFAALPQLTKISLCYSQKTDSGEIGYTIPHLAKIYTKNYIKLENEKEVLDKYEIFTQEKKNFNNGDLNNIQLLYRSNASNHKERVAANNALRALSLSNFDYDVAMDAIEDLIRHNNKFPFLYLIKGKIQENSFHPDAYEKAKKEFMIAIEIDSNFLEALIELGFLELKSRVSNKKNSKEVIKTSIDYFEKALKIEDSNQRTHLGLAQSYSAQAKDINFFYNKIAKHNKAELANSHFEKAYYYGDHLTPTQIHSNAITSFSHALNYQHNFRDYINANRVCENGLGFEPKNPKLLQLKENLEYKLNPKKYSQEKFKEKGWIK